MSCFHPVTRTVRGSGQLLLPCGVCLGCRLRTVRSWSLRCMHEAQLYPRPSSFVTLTYDDDHAFSPSLNYSDFKRFIRRTVDAYGPTRYFMAGEYGSLNLRPHFHAILFGLPFPDRVPIKDGLYRSPALEALWPSGFSSVGELSRESAAYVASYSVKGSGSRTRYYDSTTGECLTPPFCRMSLRPGIGDEWLKKYWPEVYLARDGIVGPSGVLCAPPRYYDKKLEERNPALYEQKRLVRLSNSLRDPDRFKALRMLSSELDALSRQKLKGRRL